MPLELRDQSEDALRVLFAVAVAAARVEEADDGHFDVLGDLFFLLFGGQFDALHLVVGHQVERGGIGGLVEFPERVEELCVLASRPNTCARYSSAAHPGG